MTTDIQPHADAPLGSVETRARYSPGDFFPTDVILCRTNAPLVSFAFALLRRDVPCNILGRDIGEGLAKLVDKMKATTLPQLREKLQFWYERESGKARDKRKPRLVDLIGDKFACLSLFLDDANSVTDVTMKINKMFTEVTSGRLLLSTIHKAKGLEWDRVWLLDPDLIPSPYAEQPWQKRQEKNLMYVAVTRAKLDFFYIKSGRWQ